VTNIQLISISSTWMNTLPVTLSLLENHCDDIPNLNFLPYVFHTYKKSILEYMPEEPVDIAGATLYIWNKNRSLKLLRHIKQTNPHCMTVVGAGNAPFYDAEAENFLRTNPYINFIIHKEGEQPFNQLVKYHKGELDLTQVDAISWIENDKYYRNPLGKFPSLDVPSPYTNKNFLATMQEVDKLGLTRGTVWETNRGCPYSCSFCDWGGLVSQKIRQVPDARLFEEIDFLVRNMDEVFFGDANFGIFPRDVEIIERVTQLYESLDNPRLTVMHTGNAKNTTDRVYKIGKMLTKHNLQRGGVSLSLQTYTDEALANVKRSNIKKETYQELTKKFVADGIAVYTDMIINLPGETFATFLESLETVLEGEVTDIRTFLLEMYPNSAISQQVEEFDIKTKNNLIFKGVVEDENEYTTQVISTYSMNEEEGERLRKFTISLDILHQGKFLYFISKYLKEELGIRYVDFYLDVFENSTGFLKLIQDHVLVMKKFNDGVYNYAKGHIPFDIDWGGGFRKQQYMWTIIAEQSEQFYSDVADFLQKFNDSKLDDLLQFQKDIMISSDYNPDVGKTSKYEYNWYDYFYNNKPLVKEGHVIKYCDTHIGSLSERIPLKDPRMFMKYASGGRSYFTQRQGSYIHHSIEKLVDLVPT